MSSGKSRPPAWPTSCNVGELQGFLRLASYYQRFVRDFTNIAIARLTQKGQAFQWSEDCTAAFAFARL